MNAQQKKYTMISAIFAALSPICVILAIAMISSLSESTMPEGDVEGGAILGVLLIGFALAIFCLILIIGTAALCGVFALASYKFAQKAIISETDGMSKAILPRILNVISIAELIIFSLTLIACAIFLIIIFIKL